jgi:hypothetical protein
MVFLRAHDSKQGVAMKLLSTALLAAGLMALGACGGDAEENVAAGNASEDYNLTDDLSDENLLGNEALDNAAGADNAADGDNGAADNTSGNTL